MNLVGRHKRCCEIELLVKRAEVALLGLSATNFTAFGSDGLDLTASNFKVLDIVALAIATLDVFVLGIATFIIPSLNCTGHDISFPTVAATLLGVP